MAFGLKTGRAPVEWCFMCPDKHQLAFRPKTKPGINGYVIPGSFPYKVSGTTEFVPFPFTALAVPFDHPLVDPGGFGITFPPGWDEHDFPRLLPLVEGLDPGMSLSYHAQIGRPAGARIHPKIIEAKIPAHPWYWVVWGRDLLREASVELTAELGLATLIHQARQAAGSLPSDEELYKLWTVCQRVRNPITRYHQRLLRLAA